MFVDGLRVILVAVATERYVCRRTGNFCRKSSAKTKHCGKENVLGLIQMQSRERRFIHALARSTDRSDEALWRNVIFSRKKKTDNEFMIIF